MPTYTFREKDTGEKKEGEKKEGEKGGEKKMKL